MKTVRCPIPSNPDADIWRDPKPFMPTMEKVKCSITRCLNGTMRDHEYCADHAVPSAHELVTRRK